MKTRLLVMVGMMISTAIFAQRENRESRKPEVDRNERVKRELALTDKQYASVKELDTKYDKQFREFERKRLEQREATRSLRLDRDRDIRKLLTPEQNKKRDDMRSFKKGKRGFEKHDHEKGKRKHDRFRHDRERKHDRRDRDHDRG